MDKENVIGQVSTVETYPLKRTQTESVKGSLSERKVQSDQAGEGNEKKIMEPFVTVRPPRGRRQNQTFAAMGPSNQPTIQNLQPSFNKEPSHRHRSSSQPRPSRTVESLPPTQMNNSIRSVSQPRSAQNTHFLDGFNVADCFDVRNIPDPPSPSNSRKRHRRRVSSAVLRPMSSMDVDNRGNNQAAITNSTDSTDKKSSFVTRRKRMTLSHVPAPMNSEFEQDSNTSSVLESEERCDVEARPNCSQINLCRDEGEDDVAKLSPRRKKKRQSMVIPRDLPHEEDGSTANIANQSNVAMNSSPKAKKGFVPLDFKSMQKLRSLVRGYCSLPKDIKGGSDEAKEIFSMTGYALPKNKATTNDVNKSESMLSNRQLVIKKIAPVLAQMESRKKQDVKRWEEKTQCRVTKSERSGRYKYYDIETNNKVGSQEYKRRYISVLESEQPNRILRARKWMEELSCQANTYHAPEEPEHFEYADSFRTDHEKQKQLEIIEMQQREAFLPPRNINLVREGTSRDRDVVTIECNKHHEKRQDTPLNTSTRDEMDEIAEITEASSEDTDDNSRESISPNPDNSELIEPVIAHDVLPASEQKEICSDFCNNANGSNNAQNIPLLPLPSQDMESADPEIAAAEKRLWDKIDLALHEYSGEVMMIRNKRRRLAEAHPEPINNQNGEGN